MDRSSRTRWLAIAAVATLGAYGCAAADRDGLTDVTLSINAPEDVLFQLQCGGEVLSENLRPGASIEVLTGTLNCQVQPTNVRGVPVDGTPTYQQGELLRFGDQYALLIQEQLPMELTSSNATARFLFFDMTSMSASGGASGGHYTMVSTGFDRASPIPYEVSIDWDVDTNELMIVATCTPDSDSGCPTVTARLFQAPTNSSETELPFSEAQRTTLDSRTISANDAYTYSFDDLYPNDPLKTFGVQLEGAEVNGFSAAQFVTALFEPAPVRIDSSGCDAAILEPCHVRVESMDMRVDTQPEAHDQVETCALRACNAYGDDCRPRILDPENYNDNIRTQRYTQSDPYRQVTVGAVRRPGGKLGVQCYSVLGM